MAPAIGIDLGTTYSCVAICEDGQAIPTIIFNDSDGKKVTPSWVSLVNDECIVGEEAKEQALVHSKETVFEAKRIIGRQYFDNEVQENMPRWPFEVVNIARRPMIRIRNEQYTKIYSPEQISAFVLAKMKDIAQRYLGRDDVRDAVITVPAQFNDAQRRATIDAGKLAGLNVLALLMEPTAAALAYELRWKDRTQGSIRHVLVFDLGGGTFDVSLLKIDGSNFEVLATNGNTSLGGVDFDECLVTYFCDQFKSQHHVDLRSNPMAMRRLRYQCEKIKKFLSTSMEVNKTLPNLFGNVDFSVSINRRVFEVLCRKLFKETIRTVKQTLCDAGVDKHQVEHVVLVGGSTRIPRIKQMLADLFGNDKLMNDVNPDEVVACGAALHAAQLAGRNHSYKLVDVSAMSVGIEDYCGEFRTIIPKNAPLPAEGRENFHCPEEQQEEVEIPIYEGERLVAKENNYLGKLHFTADAQHTFARGSQFKIVFKMDTDGLLYCFAEDLANNHEQRITLNCNQGRITAEEMEYRSMEIEQLTRRDRDLLDRRIKRRKMTEACTSANLLIEASDANLEDKTAAWGICRVFADWVSVDDFDLAEWEDKMGQLDILRRKYFKF